MYNVLFYSKKFKTHLLCNTYSNLFIKVDKDNYEKLIKLKNNTELIETFKNKDFFLKYKLIVEDDLECYNNKVTFTNLIRYNTSTLNLTIAPTDECNFACPYCYESNSKGYMSKDTLQNIVNYIEQSDVKKCTITWYGGEPLMCFDTIKELSNKVIALNIDYSASIVSNGFLLTKEKAVEFEKLNIKMIQITLDGLKDTHNLMRPHKHHTNSFDIIIKNIESFFEVNSTTGISIRVNLDKNNIGEYSELKDFLQKKFSGERINVYPAFIDWEISDSCNSCNISLDRMKKLDEFIKIHKGDAQYNDYFYPKTNLGGSCMMRVKNAYLIGPDGNMYKCWHHLTDKNKSIGNVNEKYINNTKVASYLNKNDYLHTNECASCKLFPLCDGGCSDLRIKNIEEAEKYDYCLLYKDNIESFLESHYEKKLNP